MVATPTSSIGFQNFYSSTLSADITTTSTDIFINVVPSVSESFLVIDPDSTTGREIIYYNSKTATKVVCPSVADGRGQGDTSASAHLSGTTVIMAPVAEYFETLLSLFTTSPQGWTTGSGTISAVTYNGNRSYSLTTSSDLSAVVSPGMRLSTTRTTAAPTQCTNLNGTTQYYSKATPNKMTFTDDFVCSAWIKLTSYPAVEGAIVTRFNGTSGWSLKLTSTGQVYITGFNAGSSNYSQVGSYQSVPLGKWTHVTAQLDMSAFTATTTTSYVMLDGVDVPASVTRGGTNPTALVQAGNLEIGSQNSGVQLFPGKIAQVAVFNAKVTQATMRGYMSQGLTGSETSLASAYSFNNAITDLNTTTPNDLTANGSALATNADSPFGGQANGTISSTLDYGIIQTVSASTLVVQVAEGCTIPTTGSIASFRYSTYKSPYGFPGQTGKWEVSWYARSNPNSSSTSQVQYAGRQITLPIGEWDLTLSLEPLIVSNAAGHTAGFGLSTTTTTFTDLDLYCEVTSQVASNIVRITFNRVKQISASAATTYYLVHFVSNAAATTNLGPSSDYITLRNALL